MSTACSIHPCCGTRPTLEGAVRFSLQKPAHNACPHTVILMPLGSFSFPQGTNQGQFLERQSMHALTACFKYLAQNMTRNNIAKIYENFNISPELMMIEYRSFFLNLFKLITILAGRICTAGFSYNINLADIYPGYHSTASAWRDNDKFSSFGEFTRCHCSDSI